MCKYSCNYGPLSGVCGNKIPLGHYAVSLRGHDAGKIYLIVGVQGSGGREGCFLLADGKSRPAASPKAKKPKHVNVLRERDDDIAALLFEGKRVDDAMLIHSLKQVAHDRNCDY